MKNWILTMCLVVATLLVVSACGSSDKSTAGANAGGDGQVKEFTINAKNFEFDLKDIKVKKGDTVKITLKNTEGFHAVKFDGYNKEVQANKTITFVADKAGEFPYICSIVCGIGHDKMTGKLIVE